jgi:hypothetical protein
LRDALERPLVDAAALEGGRCGLRVQVNILSILIHRFAGSRRFILPR